MAVLPIKWFLPSGMKNFNCKCTSPRAFSSSCSHRQRRTKKFIAQPSLLLPLQLGFLLSYLSLGPPPLMVEKIITSSPKQYSNTRKRNLLKLRLPSRVYPSNFDYRESSCTAEKSIRRYKRDRKITAIKNLGLKDNFNHPEFAND